MELKKLILGILTMSLLIAAFAGIPPTGGQQDVMGPFLDMMVVRYPIGGIAGVDAMISDEVDCCFVYDDPGYYKALDEGFIRKLYFSNWLEGYGFNMRKEPFDDRIFREAMAYCADPSYIIREVKTRIVYPPQSSALERTFATLWQGYAPDVEEFEYDPEMAILTLIAGGYEPVLKSGETEPHVGTIQTWKYPNGTEIRTLNAWLCTTWSTVVMTMRQWIQDMQSIGIPVIERSEPAGAYYSRVMNPPFPEVDFFYSWTTHSPPTLDTLAYNFASDYINTEWTWNMWGIANDTVDTLCDQIIASMDRTEISQLMYELQYVLRDICSFVPWVAGEAPWFYRPEFTGLNEEVYLQYNVQSVYLTQRRKEGPGGLLRHGADDAPYSMNPALGYSGMNDYGVTFWLWTRAKLIDYHPETMVMQPWIAEEWRDYETWDGPYGPGTGQKVAITLRNDVSWHDGLPVTVNDIQFNLEYEKNHSIAEASSVYWDLNYTNILNDYQIEIYYNTQSISRMFGLDTWALAFPPQIWSTVADPQSWTGWNEYYTTVDNGPLGTVRLSKLIGAGPFMFPENFWDTTAQTITAVANRNFFTRVLVADVTYDRTVDIFDVVTIAKAFGCEPGDAEWKRKCDIAAAWGLIDIFDVVTLAKEFGQSW